MNRSILNFEATVSSDGLNTKTGESLYAVRLYVNHRIIRSWTLPLHEGYILTQDRAHLDEFIARKLFYMLHPDMTEE